MSMSTSTRKTKRKLAPHEVAYVLAGLRLLQTSVADHPDDDWEPNLAARRMLIEDEGYELPDVEELNELCEAINLGEVRL